MKETPKEKPITSEEVKALLLSGIEGLKTAVLRSKVLCSEYNCEVGVDLKTDMATGTKIKRPNRIRTFALKVSLELPEI